MSHHVLIVDDDPGIRAAIRMILEDEGYDVQTAANGREALDRIIARRPSLVLLDLQMPVMSGWELQSRLRGVDRRPAVVFMTAGSRARVEAEAHHADGYLRKPFELDHLLATVARFVAAA